MRKAFFLERNNNNKLKRSQDETYLKDKNIRWLKNL